MALFKAVKKPVIRNTTSAASEGSTLRPKYVPKQSPCAVECPIGCDIRGALLTLIEADATGLTTDSALDTAWRRITARNPFPSVCGRVCSHPCEANCHRRMKEGPVAVHVIERYVGDHALGRGLAFPRAKDAGLSINVLGAGPVGLSAACHLAKRGYRVTVVDEARPGGVLRGAVPNEILDAEIARILALGVELSSIPPDAVKAIDSRPDEISDPADIATAIAAGIRLAENMGTASAAPRGAAIPKQKIRPEWYPDRQPLAATPDSTLTELIFQEARRCFTCGMCMGCGNCWSYCTKSGFEKVASGRRYKLTLDRCNGCAKCADGCPSGYIDMI